MPLFSRKPKPTRITSLADLEPMIASGRPILVDLHQPNCRSCKIMDGIVNELADEYAESAHVVKVDVTTVPGAIEQFKVRSTPTFVLMGRAPDKRSKKDRRRPTGETRTMSQRWRTSCLVKKDELVRVLESNGAERRGDDDEE
jgi:thiol-disulfide isomerase/thioredoxin